MKPLNKERLQESVNLIFMIVVVWSILWLIGFIGECLILFKSNP